MSKIFILNAETKEVIQIVSTQLQAYRARYLLLSKDGIDTTVEKERKKLTPNKQLDKKCEELWREISLKRSGFMCEYCQSIKNIQVHHIITRSVRHLKWNTDNAASLCSNHHTLSSSFSAHKTPDLFRLWLNRERGEGYFERLRFKSNMPQKVDLQLEYAYLQSKA